MVIYTLVVNGEVLIGVVVVIRLALDDMPLVVSVVLGMGVFAMVFSASVTVTRVLVDDDEEDKVADEVVGVKLLDGCFVTVVVIVLGIGVFATVFSESVTVTLVRVDDEDKVTDEVVSVELVSDCLVVVLNVLGRGVFATVFSDSVTVTRVRVDDDEAEELLETTVDMLVLFVRLLVELEVFNVVELARTDVVVDIVESASQLTS